MQPKPSKATAKTLVEAFTELPDPRVIERCDHLLHEVLVIAVCGMLAGGESFYDMEDFAIESERWLRGFLTLPGGIPRHDTFNRVFRRFARAPSPSVSRAGRKACASGCAAERPRRAAKWSRSTARRCAVRAGATIRCAPSSARGPPSTASRSDRAP